MCMNVGIISRSWSLDHLHMLPSELIRRLSRAIAQLGGVHIGDTPHIGEHFRLYYEKVFTSMCATRFATLRSQGRPTFATSRAAITRTSDINVSGIQATSDQLDMVREYRRATAALRLRSRGPDPSGYFRPRPRRTMHSRRILVVSRFSWHRVNRSSIHDIKGRQIQKELQGRSCPSYSCPNPSV